jgi:radical SAM protein with 4Fe4S-binding SPASM domain
MSFDAYVTCVTKLPSDVSVSFCGMSEPWLNKECTRMVQHVAEQGREVSVFTTLLGMSLHDVEVLQGYEYRHFCIHAVDTSMRIDVDNDYIQVLRACLDKIKGISFALHGELHPRVREVVGDIRRPPNSLNSRAGNVSASVVSSIEKKGKIRCSACGPDLQHNVLLPNGNVVLCCMDYGMDHVLGNLLSGTYESLFLSAEYRRVKRGHLDESLNILCRKCRMAETI